MTTYTCENTPPSYKLLFFEFLKIFEFVLCNFFFLVGNKKIIYVPMVIKGGRWGNPNYEWTF